MNKGLLIILSGPSGVGKGTIRKYIFEHYDLDLHYSISMTTRSPRNQEVDGQDYYFVSQETFQKNIDKGNFLEWEEFVGNRYGTPKDKVEEIRNKGHNVFLEIEVNGASKVMSQVKDEGLITFFLVPPSIEALEERIRNRKTETDAIIHERLEKGKSEMDKAKNYDHVIINDNLERASQKIVDLINERLNKIRHSK